MASENVTKSFMRRYGLLFILDYMFIWFYIYSLFRALEWNTNGRKETKPGRPPLIDENQLDIIREKRARCQRIKDPVSIGSLFNYSRAKEVIEKYDD
jgi:hypothetical protein